MNQPDKFNRPNGYDFKWYGKYEVWSDQEWAWQFLRRNSEFRRRCKALRDLLPDEQKKEQIGIARQFGLKKFKCATKGGRPPSFNKISTWSQLSLDEVKTLKINLHSGQTVIRFDVLPAVLDANAIEMQLSQAREILKKKLKDHCSAPPGRHLQRKTPTEFLAHLRILDAKLAKTDGLLKDSESTIYGKLYPNHLELTADEKRQKFRDAYKLARKWAEHYYLTLAISSQEKKG
ncbi:hypothetical protein ACO0K9_20240 [Undibacterium sp. Ji50W]|uniref:hypothetical protein n=1 Tax=Undibacterium sp. Ji50W TaxID=3413041 RepID=UPI003BF39449